MIVFQKLLAILILFVSFGCNPKPESNQNIYIQFDSLTVMQHLKTITKTEGFRNFSDTTTLNQTAEYIFSVFSQYADTVYYQEFQVYAYHGTSQLHSRTYKNVVCRLGSTSNKPLVVVGAHYDTVENTEGADDNASGVVGLLELVRIFSKEKLNYPIEIVAYTLEENFLYTENSGSFIHAKSLRDAGIPVYGMVVFEMIGYFDDKANSQSYPIKALKVIYGSKGNYILLAQKYGAGTFARRFSGNFKRQATIKTKSIKAPLKWGVNRSDHYNYWKFGYDALMITNTANFRNPNYHKSSDTMETLDIPEMMKVINATALAIINLK